MENRSCGLSLIIENALKKQKVDGEIILANEEVGIFKEGVTFIDQNQAKVYRITVEAISPPGDWRNPL